MLYFVIYLLVFYVSCSRSVTSVGEEKDNFSFTSLRTVLNRDKKLTPPTVGRQSADLSVDLSADKMPDFSSFFIGRQK